MVYDKELFNYEEYKARGLATQKTLTRMIFIKNGKKLVQDFYKAPADSPFLKYISTFERV